MLSLNEILIPTHKLIVQLMFLVYVQPTDGQKRSSMFFIPGFVFLLCCCCSYHLIPMRQACSYPVLTLRILVTNKIRFLFV